MPLTRAEAQEPGRCARGRCNAAARRAQPRGARADRGRGRGPLRAAGLPGLRRRAIPAARGLPALPVGRGCAGARSPARARCWRTTTLHHSNDLFFRERMPWRLGLVQLDAGPTVMVHLHGDVGAAPARGAGRRAARPRRAGGADRIPDDGGAEHGGRPDAARDDQRPASSARCWSPTARPPSARRSCGPGEGRRRHRLGRATPSPGRSCPGLDDIAALPQVTLVPLDLTNARSVTELAGEIGGKVDIVVNTAELHRALRHRGAARHRRRPRRDGHQLFRPAAPGAGLRSGAARPRRRRRTARRGLGQPAVDLCAVELPAARHLLGVQGGGAVAGAVPARRDAAGRHPRRQRLSRADRRRVEPEPAAAQGGAGGARRRPS